jgi:hypothetical protein
MFGRGSSIPPGLAAETIDFSVDAFKSRLHEIRRTFLRDDLNPCKQKPHRLQHCHLDLIEI